MNTTVHAAGENEFDFFHACGHELCEAFSTSCPCKMLYRG